jgi:hypothetical protein
MLGTFLFVLQELWKLFRNLVTSIIVIFFYYIFIVPIGLFIQIIGKDLLMQKLDKRIQSYWVKRKQAVRSMKDQF